MSTSTDKSLVFESKKTFTDFIKETIAALGITNTTLTSQIENELLKFNNDTQYKLIDDEKLKTLITELNTSNKEIADLVAASGKLENAMKVTSTKLLWDKMTGNIAELELLSVLQGVNTSTAVVDALIEAFNKKLTAVNDILKENVKSQKGGNLDDLYKQKYLKYKTKYLSLKKL